MYSIGIDIGGMSAKVGIVEEGHIKAIRSVPTNSTMPYDYFLEQVSKAVEELSIDAGEDGPGSIGISSCGLIDSQKGKITYSNNIRWEDKSIVADIWERFKVPVKIANDAKCAVLAEAVLGAGKNYERVCMITLGTGVGGGFITGKKLDIGDPYSDASGILGHLTVEAGGRQCTCGHRGCLEAYASATAITASFKNLTGQELTAKEVLDRVRMGGEAATEVFHEFRFYLAEGLVTIANILRPEIIVIGGGLSMSADLFVEYLEEYVNSSIYGGNAIPVRIAAAKLGNDAGMIGATLL